MSKEEYTEILIAYAGVRNDEPSFYSLFANGCIRKELYQTITKRMDIYSGAFSYYAPYCFTLDNMEEDVAAAISLSKPEGVK